MSEFVQKLALKNFSRYKMGKQAEDDKDYTYYMLTKYKY